MKRFCLECGNEARTSDVICTECGNALQPQEVESPKRTIQVQQRPMSAKNKIMLAVVAVVAVLFFGFYKFGNSYASAESTLKRFHKAVIAEDKKALGKLVEFEGGIKLSSGELDAIMSYAAHSLNDFTKSVGLSKEASEQFLYTVQPSGKVFGIFDGHKISVRQQYVSAPMPVEGIAYTLNGEKLKITEEDGRAIIGPVAPGIYELKAEFKGDYMELSESEEIELLDRFGDKVYANMELEMNNVYFELDVSNGTDPTKSSLVIGDTKLDFNASGFIESVGPLLFDGSIKGKVVTEFPWGTIESDEFEIGSTSMYLDNRGLNSEVEARIAKTVLAYGEEYVVAHAAADTKDMKTITDEWKEELQYFFDYGRVHGILYSGQLNEVQIYFEEAAFRNEDNQFKFYIPVSLLTVEEKIEYGQAKRIENTTTCSMELIYLNNEWKINECEGLWSTEVGGTILEGSKTFVKANGDVDAYMQTDDE